MKKLFFFLFFLICIIVSGYPQNNEWKHIIEYSAKSKTANSRDAGWYDVSEYLLGKVYVKVFFVESSGGSENWTTTEKNICQLALTKATDSLVAEFNNVIPNAPASCRPQFIISYDSVNVSMEPIEGEAGPFSPAGTRDAVWVQEIMDSLGYSDFSGSTYQTHYNVAEYCDYLRKINNTDWAICVFLVDNSNDADGKFSNGVLDFAAGIGGPYCVLVDYLKPLGGSVTLADFPLVPAHEMIHLFYAMDEYSGNPWATTDKHEGYLDGYNLNALQALGENCLMLGATAAWQPVCSATCKCIGWTDSNGNNIPDILDINPSILLNTYGDSLIPPQSVIYSGTSYSPALSNINPYETGAPFTGPVVLHSSTTPYPWANNDITINTILYAEYRINSDDTLFMDWTPAVPDDGAFDSVWEAFSFITPLLDTGIYIIEVRVINSAGLSSYVISDTVYIGLTTTFEEFKDGNSDLIIFPSPANGTINIIMNAAEKVATLSIYSISGREMIRQQVPPSATGKKNCQLQIDTRNLPGGIYFIRFTSGHSQVIKKLIIER